REFQKAVPEPGFSPIDHRRQQPLDNHRIALQQQPKRLAKIPSVRVQVTLGRELNDVSRWPRGNVLCNAPHEDETTIVVAVRGGKAPCTTSALNGQRQEYLMLAGYAVEQRI